MAMPSNEEVSGQRIQQFTEQLLKTMESPKLDKFRSLIQQLADENELDMAHVAAALVFENQKERPLKPSLHLPVKIATELQVESATETAVIEIKTVVTAKSIAASVQRTGTRAQNREESAQNSLNVRLKQRMPTLIVMAFQWSLIA